MLWIKNHRPLSLLLFSAVAFFLFFLLGPSLSCSAASYTYTPVVNSVEAFDFTNVPFTPHFVRFDIQQVSGATFQQCNANIGVSNNAYPSSPFNLNFTNYICISNIRDNFNGSFVCPVDSGWVYKIEPIFPANFNSIVTMTLLDSLEPEQEPCPDCPEVPETPYGDKLDKIYNAIMIGSATLLVIYFFFAIYSMFFGGLKR